MKSAADRDIPVSCATQAMSRTLRLATRAQVGILIRSSLGLGRDLLLEHLLEALSDERPALIFGQSIWPPAERPTKLRADVTPHVRTKSELFSRLAQATPGAALIAASDCGLSLFDLAEASLRAGSQLIYLVWSSQEDSTERFVRDLFSDIKSRSQRVALAQALPRVLPLWVGVQHAPDGSFCVNRIAETSAIRFTDAADFCPDAKSDAAEPSLVAHESQDLFKFQQDAVTAEGALRGSFVSTGYSPQCLERLALDEGVNSEDLARELFRSTTSYGVSGNALPLTGFESPRPRRFLSPERPFDTKRA